MSRRTEGLTRKELPVAIAFVVVLGLVALPVLSRVREQERHTLCQANLKQMGQVFKLYASEAKNGLYPPVKKWDCDQDGAIRLQKAFNPSPDGYALYPEFMTDISILECPGDDEAGSIARGDWHRNGDPNGEVLPCRFRAMSYIYYGFMLIPPHYVDLKTADPNDPNLVFGGVGWKVDAIDHFRERMKQHETHWDGTEAGGRFMDEDFSTGAKQDMHSTFHRLREGVWNFYLNELDESCGGLAESDIWVMADEVMDGVPEHMHHKKRAKRKRINHLPWGCNVLFMDGHVHFERYPGMPPVSRAFGQFHAHMMGSRAD